MQNQTEQTGQKLTEEEIREKTQEVLVRYRKLKAMVWPAGVARETIENFRKQIQELEARKQEGFQLEYHPIFNKYKHGEFCFILLAGRGDNMENWGIEAEVKKAFDRLIAERKERKGTPNFFLSPAARSSLDTPVAEWKFSF